MNLNPLKNKELGKKIFQRTCSVSFTLHGLKRRFFMDATKPFTLGRARHCDICIPHPDISPVQCRIEPSPEGKMVLFSEDEASPTLINGYPVPFKALEFSDRIKVGSIKIQVDQNIALHTGGADHRIVYDDQFGPALLQSLRNSPRFLIPAALYALVIWLLWDLEITARPLDGRAETVIMGMSDSEELLALDDVEEDREKEKLTPPEPMPADDFREFQDSMEQDGLDFIDVYDLARTPYSSERSSAGVGMDSFMPPAVLRREMGTGNKAWKAHMGRLRATGMDVAILFDSTGSMSGFITEVKDTIEEMVHVMKGIIPDIRICLMTYKGAPRSSPYVVAFTPLVSDPYELLNFIRFVEVGGGSAELCSAIGTAMKAAKEELVWRKGVEQAMVIIGDAPPFMEERKSCVNYARRFKGKVATIYKASSGGTLTMEPETTATFIELAREGGGSFIRHDTEGDVVRHIVGAILDPKWEREINAVFEQRRSGKWEKVVKHKVESGEIDWLLWKFSEPSVRPELVNALIDVGDARVAREMWQCLGRKDADPWLIQRSIYVLQNITGMQFDYDPAQRDSLTKAQFLFIAENLKRVYGSSILEMAEAR